MAVSNNNSTIKYSVDASGVEAGVNKIKASASQLSATQTQMAQQAALVDAAMKEAAAGGFDLNARAAKRLVQQYQQLNDTAGKTRLEILNQRAAAAGVSSTFASMSADIEKATAGTHEFSFATAGAQRELLVMAHELSQGNYKNFAGSLLVEAQRVGATSLIFSAAGASVAAVFAIIAAGAYAIYESAEQLKEFNAALTITNNSAGLTRDSFNNMARDVAAAADSSFGKASSTLLDLAKSGLYSSDQMQVLATSILQTSKITGESAADIAKQYEGLAEDPAKWALAHEKSTGFINAATYELISTLQKAGDTSGAVTAALDADSAALAKSTADHVGAATGTWEAYKKAITDAWNAHTLFTNSDTSLAPGAVEQAATPTTAQARNQQDNAQLVAAQVKVQKDAVAAQADLDKQKEQLLTNAEKRAQAYKLLAQNEAKVAANGNPVSASEDTKLRADIEQRYKDPKPTHVNESGINANLTRLRGDNQLIEAEETRSQAHLKAIRSSGLIDNEQYLQQLHDLQANSLNQQISNAYGAVQEAAQKKNKSAEQAALTEYQKLVSQRVDVEQKYTEDVSALARQRATDIQRYDAQQAETLRRQVTGYANTNSGQFDSPQQRADNGQRLQLQEQYNQQVVALDQKYDLDPASDKSEKAQKLTDLKSYYQQEQAALEANLANQQQVRDSYTDQTHLAVNSIAGDGMTGAETVATAFKSAWSDSSNALAEFVTTGKGSFASFTSSVLADFAKIALQAAEMQIFKSVSTSFFSTGGDVGHFADGGSIVGAGTGTSDSIPAMLSNGEYVINANSTKKYRSLLESINSGHMSHFATGGIAGSVAPSSAPASGGSPVSVTVHNNGGGGLSEDDGKAIHALVTAYVNKTIDKKMRGQGGFGYQIKYGMI